MYYFMNSGPKFTRLVWLNAGGIARDHVFPIFDILSRSGDIGDQSREKSVQILYVFGPPNFFRGGPDGFLDLDYLFRVVKFRGDRPRELGDPMGD